MRAILPSAPGPPANTPHTQLRSNSANQSAFWSANGLIARRALHRFARYAKSLTGKCSERPYSRPMTNRPNRRQRRRQGLGLGLGLGEARNACSKPEPHTNIHLLLRQSLNIMVYSYMPCVQDRALLAILTSCLGSLPWIDLPQPNLVVRPRGRACQYPRRMLRSPSRAVMRLRAVVRLTQHQPGRPSR